MTKRKYKCPHCKNVNVLKEKDTRICLTCGFQSLPTYEKDSDTMKNIMTTAPKIVKELMFFDDKIMKFWLPSILDVNLKGIVFPEGIKEKWKWAYAPYVVIQLFDRINHPIPGKQDEYYEYRLGLENIEYYENNDFISAIKRLGVNEEDLI